MHSVNMPSVDEYTPFVDTKTSKKNDHSKWNSKLGIYLCLLIIGIIIYTLFDKYYYIEKDIKTLFSSDELDTFANVDVSPFYRYYSSSSYDHFYTTNINEIGTNVTGETGSYGYTCEGNVGGLWDSEVNGKTSPLYRYWSSSASDHFYTTNYDELGDGSGTAYSYEGIAGYIFDQEMAFSQPLYRYYSSSVTDHFYTTNYDELGDGSGTSYSYEGIAGYTKIYK